MGSILVLYLSRRAPIRSTLAEHLYSFRRHSGRPTIYINLAVRSVPAWIHQLDIDLVVLHTMLLTERWQPDSFREMARRMRPLRRIRAPRVALPQDEFLNTDLMVEVLDDVGVDHVFTCAPQQDWAAIYGPLMATGVGLTQILPGYLEADTVRHIKRLSDDVPTRDIDIGYRAWKPKPWLGRHGMMKGWIADAVTAGGVRRGLHMDISLQEDYTLLGDAWYRFLLRSRYTIGVEGGASVLDRDGRARACADAYAAAHPDAGFEEVEQHCFPGLDGQLNLRTISPRHLEACATRTPQILVEGAYSEVLEAGRHYLPLQPDFGNLAALLDEVANGEDHREIADQAYADVVASGRYSYEAMVQSVLSAVSIRSPGKARRGTIVRALSAWEQASDGPSWGLVRIRQLAVRLLGRAGVLPSIMSARAARRDRRLSKSDPSGT